MPRNYDFIIQIIGAAESGKTKVACIIAEALKKYGVNSAYCEIPDEKDYSEIEGKNVYITEFRAKDDSSIKNS